MLMAETGHIAGEVWYGNEYRAMQMPVAVAGERGVDGGWGEGRGEQRREKAPPFASAPPCKFLTFNLENCLEYKSVCIPRSKNALPVCQI